jgi:hypothetical protein
MHASTPEYLLLLIFQHRIASHKQVTFRSVASSTARAWSVRSRSSSPRSASLAESPSTEAALLAGSPVLRAIVRMQSEPDGPAESACMTGLLMRTSTKSHG